MEKEKLEATIRIILSMTEAALNFLEAGETDKAIDILYGVQDLGKG